MFGKKNDGLDFWRGMIVAIPISLLLWFIIYLIIKAILK